MFARLGLVVALMLSAGISTTAIAGSANDLSACANAQQQKKYDEGIETCTRALAARGINPSDQAFALQRRARLFAALRKFDEAIADFSEVIRLKPSFAENYWERASAHSQKGEHERALSDLDEAVRLDPANIRIRVQRGHARANLGKSELALADFEAVIRAEPRSGDAFIGRNNPNEALHYNNRCYTLALADRAREALPDCHKALSLRPNSPPALDSKGFVHLRLGEYQTAIEDYEAALRSSPRMAPALYGRGIARLRMGDSAGNADVAEALKIDPAIVARMAGVGVTP